MAADLKLEILYYRTASDFEMEFNLCGCCSMRLLTSKPSLKKELLISLSKAIERSRAVIVVGELWGDDGIVDLISRAIGKPLAAIPNTSFILKDGSTPMLPESSVALTADSGALTGCLIESGPQVIIMLSENRKLRHSVLKNTIYEYIKIMSSNGAGVSASKDTYISKHSKPEDPIDISSSLQSARQNRSITQDELCDNIPMHKTDKPVSEITPPKSKKRRRHPVLATFICIFSAIALTISGTAGYYFWYEPFAAANTYKELSQKNAFDLAAENSDFYAMISVPGTEINYPVVDASENLAYYKTHLFNGDVNRFGTPYTLSSSDADNTIIYGLSDRGGFGQFADYLNNSENGILAGAPKIALQIPSGETKYFTIFSVFEAKDANFDYKAEYFIDESEFSGFLESASTADSAMTGLKADSGCKIITIICEEKEREIIVMAFSSPKSESNNSESNDSSAPMSSSDTSGSSESQATTSSVQTEEN